MNHIAFLAWQYLRFHKLKSSILTIAITLVIYLPVALNVVVTQSSEQLLKRAETTPLLLGARGSPAELVLNGLYFRAAKNVPLSYADLDKVRRSGRAQAIPLHIRFRSRDFPIVGTSLSYFRYRSLTFAEGRPFAVIGEAVLGANAARKLGVKTGGSVISSPETLFDLAGTYPLKMSVIGVLEPAYNTDDDAIFVDVKTSWIIQGIGHGHQDLAKPDAGKAVLKRDGDKITANASVLQYNEVTKDNRKSFHFHGDKSAYPLTAILPTAKTHKDRTLLFGEFDNTYPDLLMVEPHKIVEDLVNTLLQVEQFVYLAVLLIGSATFLLVCMVFVLSQRLRVGEFQTLNRMGGATSLVISLQAAEIGMVILVSILLAGLLTWLTQSWGIVFVQQLLF